MDMREGVSFAVSLGDRQRLREIAVDGNRTQKHVWRARIVLLSDPGLGAMAIVARTGKSKNCVRRWQERFMREGVDGLPGTGRAHPGKTPLAPEQGAGIVRLPHTPPLRGATRWTLRAMAKAAGVAASTVWTIRQAHGLAPHRWRQFELSNDPAFVETLTGIVGLYVAPPAHAAALSIDGKPQIQALDRTQPGLPLKTGRGAAMTHDYKRHGDTTPFAALNVLDGAVSASMTPAIAARSFSSASTGSSARSPPARRSMPSSTTTPPTNTARSAPGSRSLRAGLFTSPRPRVRG